MSKTYLEWSDENQQVQQIEIVDRICIGRTCKGIDPHRRLLLEDMRVSRDHAEINWTAGKLQILDNSQNGTWVNDIRMAAGSSKDIADGDTIRIGDAVFLLVHPHVEARGSKDFTLTEVTRVTPLSEDVTTLVADVRGFTTYSQSHPSSDVVDIIKAIFDQLINIVEDFNGTIKDFAGDAIFAFWEHRFEDAATQSLRACRAAVQQMQNFSQTRVSLADKYPDAQTLQMGWGVTTGPIVLSRFGSRIADLAMVGDCVNLASRLSGMAYKEIPENILICAQTAELVENRFALKDLGMFSIRGREGQEHIFTLGTA